MKPIVIFHFKEANFQSAYASFADGAESAVGTKGAVSGTAKNNYATDLLVRYQDIYGTRGLELKKQFNNGPGNRGELNVLEHFNSIFHNWKIVYPGMTPIQLNNYSPNEKVSKKFWTSCPNK